jgi:hypothetical protein
MNRIRASWTLLAIASISLLAMAGIGQDKNDSSPDFAGNWTVRSRPYLGADFKDFPLLTTSVNNDVRKGLGITAISVRNVSSKTVSAAKFTWYVLDEQAPDTVFVTRPDTSRRHPWWYCPRLRTTH